MYIWYFFGQRVGGNFRITSHGCPSGIPWGPWGSQWALEDPMGAQGPMGAPCARCVPVGPNGYPKFLRRSRPSPYHFLSPNHARETLRRAELIFSLFNGVFSRASLRTNHQAAAFRDRWQLAKLSQARGPLAGRSASWLTGGFSGHLLLFSFRLKS